MSDNKEVLDGSVTLGLAVKTADALLSKGDKVKLSANMEVEENDANQDNLIGYILVANKETSGNCTVVTRGKRVTTEVSGEAYPVGSFLNPSSAGKMLIAAPAVATGIITVVDYSAMSTDTITVNGVVLTNGTTFTAASSNDATAKLIADAINVRVPGVRAYATAAVVTVEALVAGGRGNLIAMSTNMVAGTATVSALLSGGRDFFPMGIALELASAADQSKKVLWL